MDTKYAHMTLPPTGAESGWPKEAMYQIAPPGEYD